MTVAVTVNGETHALACGSTVTRLVAELVGRERGVAVAINAEVVARSAWTVTELRDGDRVEVLRAAQGGC
jgi:sulfur carrier protein